MATAEALGHTLLGRPPPAGRRGYRRGLRALRGPGWLQRWAGGGAAVPGGQRDTADAQTRVAWCYRRFVDGRGAGAVLVVEAFDVIVDVVLHRVLHLRGYTLAVMVRALVGVAGGGVTLRLVENLQRIVTFCSGLRWLRGLRGHSKAGTLSVQGEAELGAEAPPSFPAVGW